MPLHLQHIFDQIPLPSLRYYTIISTSIFFGNIFYFHHLIQSNKNDSLIIINSTNEIITNESINNQTIFYSIEKPFSFAYIQTLLSIIISQSFSLLILTNAIYCSIALAVKQLLILVFGELRFTELQRIKDKFWNYAFYKFCFLFGVLGLENLNELILWLSWFFTLAIAILCCQLAKDRFELISVSVSTSRQTFFKILCLLISLLYLCSGLFTICFLIGLKYGGLSIFFFMLAETILLTLDISYILFKYIFIQQQQQTNHLQTSNEHRSNVIYYLEFLFDILTLTIDILHHLQMLFYHQTFMSMSSLIFFMQLKPLFNELTQRLKRHKLYRMAMIRMENKYPLLTKYDLEQKYSQKNYLSTLEEVCSICWEKFEKARCLPCGHLFHENCLRSWFEHDTTCPICRLSLHEDTRQTTPTDPTPIQSTSTFRFWPSLSLAGLTTNAHNLTVNNDQGQGRNLFRFRGNRYSSWLPNFSIQINHNFPFRFGHAHLTSLQLTNMTQSIQHIFPQIPFEIILSDLQHTQSIDTTIENIIERRIHFESQQQETSESEESSSILSSSSSSETDESIDIDLLSDSSRMTQHNDENFTWPLDPNLSFSDRKQQLISYMRRQYLERERHLHKSSHMSNN
ncbi:unnamed protein product [Rotaria sp. Silwood2]|nr:unnamed protein product [Rotaria sp. Silwood2]CAF2960288.1 unnamed protein product [Rotaria sp. Silwood2]CAF3338567.1 unnamed protein product [Rotaria sp. Silwood2]CAF4279572.1 unnamed protein product [Rotaria sp. Silwood2]CAF4461082.1 unnamed protein product [Rotaria sp. Silwood2]